jgi:hypothetical protein
LFIQRLTILLLILVAAPANAWWDCDWKYRFTADIAKPPGRPLTDYQVRMDLNSSNVPASLDWFRQGDDLRVIDEQDDLTEMTFFIEQWDAAGQTAVIWVLVPIISGGGATVYFYYDGPAGVPSVSTPTTFSTPGFQFHTRNTSANPANRAAAEAAFANAPPRTAGYGCAIIPSYTNVNNQGVLGPPNRNRNIGLSAESFFEVTPAEAGVWEFRYGADFGRGGGLYVNDIALDEKWNSDLWWNYNWNDTSQILQGSINLSPGFHSIRILGFEDGNDGGLTVEFKRPGGTFQAMSLANIAMTSRECSITTEPVVTYGPEEAGSCPDLTVTATNQTFSDPVNGITNPKAILGSVITNTINVTNSATTAVDSDSLVLSQTVDPGSALRVTDFDGATSGPVQFLDGTPVSGLTYTFIALGSTADDVDFSNNNGVSYLYVPVAGADGSDPAVTDIQVSPKGTLNGNSGSGDPAADFVFKTVGQ